MADIGRWSLFMPASMTTIPYPSPYVLDSSDKALAFIFQAPTTLPTLTKAALFLAAITGTSPTYTVALEGVDANGNADGVPKTGCTVDVTPAAGAGTTVEYTFGTPHAPARGEWLALTVRYKSGEISAAACSSFGYEIPAIYSGTPYPARLAAATWTKRNYAPCAALGDGTSWYGGGGMVCTGNGFITTGSNPVWAGVKFTPPDGMSNALTCEGFWTFGTAAAGSNILRTSLLDAADQVLASVDYDSDFRSSDAYFRWVNWDDAAPTLTPGAIHRLVMTTLALTWRTNYVDFTSAAHRDTLPMKQVPVWTQGGPGAWVDTPTRWPMIGPVVSASTVIPAPNNGAGAFDSLVR